MQNAAVKQLGRIAVGLWPVPALVLQGAQMQTRSALTAERRVHVNLGAAALGNTVGEPLVVDGTLDAPTVTLTRAAMVGAAICTLVMPGVGTGAGASMGDKLGEKLKGLFGK